MDIVAALRSRAEMSAKAMQLMAQSKSERNQAAGDVGANYDGGTKEQTVEWKAADEIERLRKAVDRMQIGGNHVASVLIGRLGAGFSKKWPHGTSHSVVLEALGAGDDYEMWCCWNASMSARDSLELVP